MALPTPQALARTYRTPGYDDPWECVADYQRVLEYTTEHPNRGSSAVATRLNLPRSRIRPWMNDSRPDVVRGIQTAEANGWLANHATHETTTALVALAAWALSGGSINHGEGGAHVYFSLDHDDDDYFATLASTAGFEYHVVNETATERATEARPATDGSVLARVLIAMGVPRTATEKHTATSLPAFVDTLSAELRLAFARVYVLNRGAKHADKDTLTIRVERPAAYLDELVEVLRAVSGEAVTRTGKTVTVSAAAARVLLPAQRL